MTNEELSMQIEILLGMCAAQQAVILSMLTCASTDPKFRAVLSAQLELARVGLQNSPVPELRLLSFERVCQQFLPQAAQSQQTSDPRSA